MHDLPDKPADHPPQARLHAPASYPASTGSRLRQERRRTLQGMNSLRIVGLVLDYGIQLDEETDPIEAILAHEFDSTLPRPLPLVG